MVLEARKPAREEVVNSGIMKGMVCKSPQEARMIEKLSELNAGFRAECDEQSDGINPNTMCLCEGYGKDAELLVNNA